MKEKLWHRILDHALHALLWVVILAGCGFVLSVLGVFGLIWRFFKWLVNL
jgi:hypothetical protein